MRSAVSCPLLAAVLAAAAAPAFSQPGTPPATAGAEPTPAQQSAEPIDQIRTSDQVKRESVQGAATAPLRDLNVLRTKIPDVLLDALNDPYARPPHSWKCSQLIAIMQPLDDALGPDIDRIPPGDENLMDRSKETALGAAADLASDAIPFRGWVRKLTGAERHDKLVQSAIVAGDVRRAYLKGLGEARGCDPPATPSHERAGAPPVVVRRGPLKPKYPTRLPPPAAQQTPSGTPPSDP